MTATPDGGLIDDLASVRDGLEGELARIRSGLDMLEHRLFSAGSTAVETPKPTEPDRLSVAGNLIALQQLLGTTQAVRDQLSSILSRLGPVVSRGEGGVAKMPYERPDQSRTDAPSIRR